MARYHSGKRDEALEALKDLRQNELGAFQETMRMFILAELPEGDKQAMQAYNKALGRHQGTTPLFQHALLYLLGRKKEAAAKCREMDLPKALVNARGGS